MKEKLRTWKQAETQEAKVDTGMNSIFVVTPLRTVPSKIWFPLRNQHLLRIGLVLCVD